MSRNPNPRWWWQTGAGTSFLIACLLAGVATVGALHSARQTASGADGRGPTIAFQSNRGGQLAIYSLDQAGGEPVRLTPPTCEAGFPIVSPDGRRVAFTAKVYRDGRVDFDIYIVGSDGRELRKVTDSPSRWDMLPSWSPDGASVVFMAVDADGESGESAIYRVEVDGTGLRPLAGGSFWNTQPAWSPTGERIAFASRRYGAMEIYSVSPAGDDLRPLTSLGGSSEQPRWSPDGEFIAFISFPTPSAMASEVWLVDAAGGRPRAVTPDVPAVYMDLSWSPDGSRLAFASDREGAFAIYVADVTSGSLTHLGGPHAGAQTGPVWSNDGRSIAFAGYSEGNWDIYLVGADGQDAVRMTGDPGLDLRPCFLWG